MMTNLTMASLLLCASALKERCTVVVAVMNTARTMLRIERARETRKELALHETLNKMAPDTCEPPVSSTSRECAEHCIDLV